MNIREFQVQVIHREVIFFFWGPLEPLLYTGALVHTGTLTSYRSHYFTQAQQVIFQSTKQIYRFFPALKLAVFISKRGSSYREEHQTMKMY